MIEKDRPVFLYLYRISVNNIIGLLCRLIYGSFTDGYFKKTI